MLSSISACSVYAYMALTQSCMCDTRYLWNRSRRVHPVTRNHPIVPKMSKAQQTGVRPLIQLLEEDFATLCSGNLINCMVVNTFSPLLEHRARLYKQLRRVLALSSTFMSRWQNGTMSDREV